MAQTLTTNIVINAMAGNGFSQVGNTLTELGSIVNGISQKLIEFGADSINVYRDYEKSMKDAEVALATTYGRGTKDLSNVMTQLDTSATQWAASTVFHTDDVANAISEAAHAGWDYQQIMAGIPAAMELAQAGSLDLSEAVNYIVKSTNAAHIEFDEIGNFIDLWAFAANSSASTIGEFGDAMLRMGSTMRFASDPEELMTLIAVTANAGSVGTEAGTMIRNSMMRLVAPTKKANEAMAELGATSEEAALLLNDEALAAANAELAANGFSVYDTAGELKPTLEIYRELYLALGEIAGGFENIDRNEDALKILASIFPTRTITEALNLLHGAAEGYDGLYDSMKNGDAAGYGEYAAETMMDSLYGKTETFLSKVERLKQVVGEELSGPLGSVMDTLGGFVDNIANLDEGTFSALVSGLEAIAIAGPGLMLAGGAFRLIGFLLNPAGAVGLGVVALTAAAAAIEKLKEADFAASFGKMDIDSAAIMEHVNGITEGFESAYTQVEEFRKLMNDAVANYETASASLSSELLTKMVTGATLGDEDIKKLQSLGEDMNTAVIEGITQSKNKSMSFWSAFFGNDTTPEEGEAYENFIALTNSAYEEAIGQAEQIGMDLRNAMNKAFEDGQISPEEYQNILSYVNSYNEALAQATAEAQAEQDYIDRQVLFHKAQTASLDQIQEVASQINDARNEEVQTMEDRYLQERYRKEYEWNQAIKERRLIDGRLATESRRDADLAAVDEAYNQQILEVQEAYDASSFNLLESNLKQSDLGEAYEKLGEFANKVLAGQMSGERAYAEFSKMFGGGNIFAGETEFGTDGNTVRKQLSEYMTWMVAGFGGNEGLQKRIEDYESKGDYEQAGTLRQLQTAQMINDNFLKTSLVDMEKYYSENGADWMNILAGVFGQSDNKIFSETGEGGYERKRERNREEFFESNTERIAQTGEYDVEQAKAVIRELGAGQGTIREFFTTMSGVKSIADVTEGKWQNNLNDVNRAELEQIVSLLSQTYDLQKVQEDTSDKTNVPWADMGLGNEYAAYQLLFGGLDAEQYRITVIPEVDPNTTISLDPVPLPIVPHVEGEDAAEALKDQGVQVQVEGETQQLQATIEAENGKELLSYVNGDATQLHAKIMDENGKTLTEQVYGNTSALKSAIDSYNGRTITVNIQGNKMFASGGRATSASIFGEAGPEWAIPEEHSERTANLLNAAREASGFTWPDLLARFGGLNADANNKPTTLVYSPTIQAADASGVEAILREDKRRLEEWWNNKQMRDEVEVYA